MTSSTMHACVKNCFFGSISSIFQFANNITRGVARILMVHLITLLYSGIAINQDHGGESWLRIMVEDDSLR